MCNQSVFREAISRYSHKRKVQRSSRTVAIDVHCNNSLLKSKGAISTYLVLETCQPHENHMIDKTFIVFFNEDEFEVKCNCAMFEFRGILYKHSISVLVTK